MLITCFSLLHLCQGARQRVGIKFDDVLDVFRRGVRGDVLMEGNLPIHQVSGGVFVLPVFDLVPGANTPRHKAVAPDVFAVHDRFDQSGVRWAVHPLKVGEDKAIGGPNHKPPDREPSVFGVGVARIGSGVVPPQPETVHVKEGRNSETIDHVGLLLVQQNLRPVRQTGSGDRQSLVAGADMGGVVIHSIGVGGQSGGQSGAAVQRLSHLAVKPHPVGIWVGEGLLLFLFFHISVLGCPILCAVHIYNADRPVYTVDLLGFSLEGRRNRRVSTESGGQ